MGIVLYFSGLTLKFVGLAHCHLALFDLSNQVLPVFGFLAGILQ